MTLDMRHTDGVLSRNANDNIFSYTIGRGWGYGEILVGYDNHHKVAVFSSRSSLMFYA